MTEIIWPLTLLFPADYAGPVINGQWLRRPDDQIEAFFWRWQLELCVALGQRMKEKGVGK